MPQPPVLAKRAARSESASVPEAALTADNDLVEDSVQHIRELLARTVARGMDEVGKYLLKAFYDNSPELYFSVNQTKHVSLRLLLDRCESLELPVRRTFLANALRMAAITQELPASAAFHKLPASHRVELLRVKAPEKLEQLASKAVSQRLTVKKLRVLVQRMDKPLGPGRKRVPDVVKKLDACLRAIRDDETGRLAFRSSDLKHLTDEQQALAIAALQTLQKRLAELRKMLR
jgi:hypothetical protein